MSPPCSTFRSSSRQHTFRISWYFFSSYGLPNRMLPRTVSFTSHACCADSDIDPFTITTPAFFVISPTSDDTNDVLPLPTRPTTATSAPLGMRVVMFFRQLSLSPHAK